MSTIATQTQIMEHIAKLYAKYSGLDKKNFMFNSKEGKCPKCLGKGILLSDENENIGICTQCHGHRYNDQILSVKINELNIAQFLELPASELQAHSDDKKISEFSKAFVKFDIGYLALSRPVTTLSKGELQRLKLANALTEKRKNTLFILDEPAKGLHPHNIEALLLAVNELVQLNNTIIAVEHEPLMIQNSDYVIEFGGTGMEGGYLLYEGSPCGMPKSTPTGKMLRHRFKISDDTEQEISLQEICISDSKKVYVSQCFLVHASLTI